MIVNILTKKKYKLRKQVDLIYKTDWHCYDPKFDIKNLQTLLYNIILL